MSQENVEVVRRVYEDWSRGAEVVPRAERRVWTIDAGKVVRLALHWDPAGAFEAAGLRK